MTALMSERNERVFRELARELEAARRSPATIASYRWALISLERHLAAAGGPADLLAVRKADVTGWLAALQGSCAPDSVVSYFTGARRFYNWAVGEEIIGASPFARVIPPAPSGKPVAIPSDDDIRAILRACAGKGFYQVRDTALIRMLAETGGPRLSEMALLELPALDLREDTVTVDGKTGIRWWPLSARTAKAVSAYLRARDRHPHAEETARVWLAPKGPLTPSGVQKMLRRRCAQAGVTPVHPHQLRHRSVHKAKAAGMTDSDVMTLHGHKTTRMLARYGSALSAERAAAASRQLALGNQL